MANSADDDKATTDKKVAATSETTPTPAKKSRSSAQRSGDPRKRAAVEAEDTKAEAKSRHKVKAQSIGNPSWFVPVMLGLMLIGLVWVVTFYITQEQYPVESWGRWNLGGGFAFILAGFAMTTRWK